MARRALDVFDTMSFEYVEINLRAAVELAAELGVYAYDAYPILCALFSASRLLSLDNGQRHAARLVGVALIDIETQLP